LKTFSPTLTHVLDIIMCQVLSKSVDQSSRLQICRVTRNTCYRTTDGRPARRTTSKHDALQQGCGILVFCGNPTPTLRLTV